APAGRRPRPRLHAVRPDERVPRRQSGGHPPARTWSPAVRGARLRARRDHARPRAGARRAGPRAGAGDVVSRAPLSSAGLLSADRARPALTRARTLLDNAGVAEPGGAISGGVRRRVRSAAFLAVALLVLAPRPADAGIARKSWPGFGRDPQHAARSFVAGQPLQAIRWSTPVDLAPQYSGDFLLIHYGSPLVTGRNTVLVTVKTGATDGFRIDAHLGT